MQSQRFYYLVKLQFLGFRFSGWQKQPGQKTVEQMLQKTLKFILRPNVLEEPKEKSGLENCTYKDIKTKLYVM